MNDNLATRNWAKNFLFLSLIVGSVSALAFYLLAEDRIENPASFSPNGHQQRDVEAIANRVDEAFRAQWQLEDIDHADSDSNLAIARRLAIGLAGTIPSLEEIRELEQQPDSNQIHWWVSRLLEDRRTCNYLAERFTRALVGVEDGPFVVFRRRRFASWISDQIDSKLPYDQLIRQILTEDGLWTDTPAVNFYTRTITLEGENQSPDPVLLAGRTSRAFLGMRIDCLQCHDDFLGTVNLGSAEELKGGTQNDFHALAAFFAETENSILGIRDNGSRGPYEYQLLEQDKEEPIPPAVPFNAQLDQHDENLRKRLAQWITHPDNRPFARATVNRVWAIMTGRGLVQPVDDIPLEGPWPAAMEVLVDDFVANGFDLHRLIRVIAHTKTFGLQSVADFEVTSKHEQSWAVFPTLRMRPDQVAGAIAQSTKLTTIDSTAHILTQLTKFGQENEFVTRFGDPGEDEFNDRGETVTQRLLMLNGKMVAERLDNGLNTPAYLLGLSPNTEKVVETIYLSTLSRRPTELEKEHFVNLIEAENNDRESKRKEIVDLYWALINSSEFRWNH